MTGLYSPINRLMGQVTRPKGTGAEYMAELQKKPGYKPAEAEDRDLQVLMALPQMQRAEFMEKLKGQANKFPLKQRELTGRQTHHESYTLPGGENYREILLHTPMPEGKGFAGIGYHFGGTPNILASIRVKDRTSPEGKKILHLEEIQSDWHQQGREHGYGDEKLQQQIAQLKAEHKAVDEAYWKKRVELKDDPQAYLKLESFTAQKNEIKKKMARLEDDKQDTIPHGPHAKDWHELALKAMIQHAAENGYDQIAVTPGAEQAKRFGLSKQVSSVSYNPETQHFQAFKPNRETITNEKDATPERVKALIGKEAAAKLLQAPKTMGHHYLEGEDLDIGGEGMKGFYDKMVPTFLNKFGKKHGVQVQPGQINIDDPNGHSQVAMLQASGIPETQWGQISYEEKERMMAEYSAKQPPKMAPVHTFDITPQMRDDVVKNGIPRYAEGGGVHMAGGGDPKDKSFGEKLFKKFEHLPKIKPPYPPSLLDAGYAIYKYKTGAFPIENWLSDLEFRTKPFPIDTGSVPVGTQFNSTDFDSSELNKNLESIQRRAKGGSVEENVPRETTKAYKLFRVHPKHPGKLFPLFVDANTPVEMGKWINAKEGEMAQGKVKSKIGPLAYRPGWHAGDLPIATHIGEKSDPSLTAPDVRPENHAWAEVEMPNDVDWQTEATKRGTNAQGKLVPVKAHITDQIPVGGHYRYKTNPNMTGNWLIGGSMKVNRVLNDKEVSKINKAAGLADLPRAQPFNKKTFGFAKGGTVGPEEFMAEEHVNYKAKGGVVKGKVTISPNMDVMQYELLNRKAK